MSVERHFSDVIVRLEYAQDIFGSRDRTRNSAFLFPLVIAPKGESIPNTSRDTRLNSPKATALFSYRRNAKRMATWTAAHIRGSKRPWAKGLQSENLSIQVSTYEK
jgi:hypothetical protein